MLVRSRRNYSDIVNDHFSAPRNVGTFDPATQNVGTAVVGKAACGDVIKFQVKIGKKFDHVSQQTKNIIEDVKFKAFGCGSAIASSSYATELIKGLSIEEAMNVKNSDISSKLALPPVKVHCSLLAEDAIKLAIKDYLKREKNAGESEVAK